METLRGICGFLLVIAVVWLLRTTTSSYRCCCCCRVCDCIAHWFEPVLRFWPLHLTSSCCSTFFIASFFIIFIIHRPLIVLSLGCYLLFLSRAPDSYTIRCAAAIGCLRITPIRTVLQSLPNRFVSDPFASLFAQYRGLDLRCFSCCSVAQALYNRLGDS